MYQGPEITEFVWRIFFIEDFFLFFISALKVQYTQPFSSKADKWFSHYLKFGKRQLQK